MPCATFLMFLRLVSAHVLFHVDSSCWWGDSSPFLSAVLDCLSDPLRSFNAKEFLLSIIQRATTCVYPSPFSLTVSPNELPKPSLYLLSALFTEPSLDRITGILTDSLQQTCELFTSYRDKTYALSGVSSLIISRRRWVDAPLRERSCGDLQQLLRRAGEAVLQAVDGT